jgi:hypothetical protein
LLFDLRRDLGFGFDLVFAIYSDLVGTVGNYGSLDWFFLGIS